MKTSHTLQSLPLFLLLLITCSCSFSPQPPAPEEIPLQGADLYYNRSSMNQNRFEQFKLSGTTLFAECGTLNGGRHSAADQSVATLELETLNRIKQEAWEVQRYANELHADFAEPGRASSMFSPGKLTLKLDFGPSSPPVSILTAFDPVAQATEGKYAVLERFVLELRKAAGAKLCGETHFFELGNR